MGEELPLDVFRQIVGFSTNSRTLLDLWNLNPLAREAVRKEVHKISRKAPIRFDIGQFFTEKSPFQWGFYETGNRAHAKHLHEKIRELARLLEQLLEISDQFQLDNLTAAALGIQAEEDEKYLERAPFMLQKKMMHILARFKSREIAVSTVFMRPSRVIRTFRDRFDTITSLDLGCMKALSSMKLRSEVFPHLENLEKLTWHHGNIRILDKIPHKDRLKTLNFTAHIIGRPSWQDFKVLAEFQNLNHFYFGFTVPNKPSRMEMDVLLNLYQAIWVKKYGEEKEILLKKYPKIKEIGFWNAPEQIFQQISKNRLEINTINFGAVNQNLNRLCSFDSILQAFFKFEEAESELDPLEISHLNMNLHTMPAVGLDYYLPNVMDRVNKLSSLKTVSLLFKCIFYSQMTSSWSMESKKEKANRRRPVLNSRYTHFSLHSEGLCGLEDLDRQLPPSLESCSISLNLPSETGPKVIDSIVEFVKKLGSINDFPELVEFHIQILGVKCFETLTHVISESIGTHLRQVSILAPPQNAEKATAKHLLREIPGMFPNAEKISLSTDFFRILMTEDRQNSLQWPEKIRKLARKCGFPAEKCHLTTGMLPIGFVPKGDEPADITECFEEKEVKNEEEFEEDVYSDEEENEEDEEIVYESEEDELEDLERKLKSESDRRHKKWQEKKIVVLSDDEDDKENREDEEEHEDVIDWEKLSEDGEEDYENEGRNENGLLDDEAIESDNNESEIDEEEEEPEGEELADSDDDRLFAFGVNRKRRVEQQANKAKRRRIVVSDDEEE